jgi:hypothetical protein
MRGPAPGTRPSTSLGTSVGARAMGFAGYAALFGRPDRGGRPSTSLGTSGTLGRGR